MPGLDTPTITVALALLAGLVSQSLAQHLRLPGLVLLLVAGVALGPDGAGLVRPASLGDGLTMLVGFAVAVILFEGGLNLDLRRLRRERRSIRQLVTIGALVTAAGGALAARLTLGWSWRMSVLFGTLVIVTGPTVINPLLKRLRVDRSVATVLEAEGVLIDAIGAIVAMVGLDIALSPSGLSVMEGAAHFGVGLGFGAVTGLVVGAALSWLLRFDGLVSDGSKQVFSLAIVYALFAGANVVVEESGIAAVTAAGVVVGNRSDEVVRELLEFKEQLTLMLIGMLFVLLAADVRLEDVYELGLPALGCVAAIIFFVRPLNVFVGTLGTGLGLRQRAFLSWIGPRGIVAAAVASFFAAELDAHGIEGGESLRAMVFLVIAVTVLSAGLTGGLVARALGLRRASDNGWVVLGINPLSLALAKALDDGGVDVLCVDTNPHACRRAEAEGLAVLFANGLAERTLARAEVDTRTGVIGLTSNDELNYLFARAAKREGAARTLLAVTPDSPEPNLRMLRDLRGELLFGETVDVELWALLLRRNAASLRTLRVERTPSRSADDGSAFAELSRGTALPVTVHREGVLAPFTDASSLRPGDSVSFAIADERAATALERLHELGFASPRDPHVDAGEDE